MKWPRRKKRSNDEVVIRTIRKVKITERRNGTRIIEELTKDFSLRPSKRIGGPLVFLIIFLVVLFSAIVIGCFTVGPQGVWEFLKDLLRQLIEQLPGGA